MKKKILIPCTGNSARSQMAEGFLRSFDAHMRVFSAGTNPGEKVNPFAVKVMREVGIDIPKQQPKNVDQFLDQSFDYVITVCDSAKEACPIFVGLVKHRLHMGFEDPVAARGRDDEVTSVFRHVRDKIREAFFQFYSQTLGQE